MKKFTACNVQTGNSFDQSFPPFSVGEYTFKHKIKYEELALIIYNFNKDRKKSRKHHCNAFVEFKGKQKSSIIFSRDGKVGIVDIDGRIRQRKRIEDILLLASIISGSNWHLKSHQKVYVPPTSYNTVANWIFIYKTEWLSKVLNAGHETLNDKKWQEQFENGFHLIFLFHNSNIFNIEQRFLSNVVIWEWLYPHLKNPKGSKQEDESEDLAEIFQFIFQYFWKDKLKVNLKNCIFQILRNQLAHSGRLPINRIKADQWMKELPWDVKAEPGLTTVSTYMKFFDMLTHYIVMKTLRVEMDDFYPDYFFVQLDSFLSIGKIDLPMR